MVLMITLDLYQTRKAELVTLRYDDTMKLREVRNHEYIQYTISKL